MLLKILTGAFLVLAILCGSGCTIRLEDKGSVKFTFGTTIGIEHSSSETHSESRATIESQAFEDWLKSKPDTGDAEKPNTTTTQPSGAGDAAKEPE